MQKMGASSKKIFFKPGRCSLEVKRKMQVHLKYVGEQNSRKKCRTKSTDRIILSMPHLWVTCFNKKYDAHPLKRDDNYVT